MRKKLSCWFLTLITLDQHHPVKVLNETTFFYGGHCQLSLKVPFIICACLSWRTEHLLNVRTKDNKSSRSRKNCLCCKLSGWSKIKKSPCVHILVSKWNSGWTPIHRSGYVLNLCKIKCGVAFSKTHQKLNRHTESFCSRMKQAWSTKESREDWKCCFLKPCGICVVKNWSRSSRETWGWEACSASPWTAKILCLLILKEK